MADAIDGDFSRSQAILIGASDYRQLAPVPAARNSLERMRSVLTGPLCGWPADRVQVSFNHRVAGDLPDLLVEKFEAATDVALFYFVGHGQLDPDDNLCLALCDTSTKPARRRTTSLTFEDVRNAFRMSKAVIKIAIVDCCFAGMAVDSASRLSGVLEIASPPPGTHLMMASGPYSTAWYQVAGDNLQPQTYFTKYLIDVVERGAPNRSPGLTLGHIFERTADLLVRDGKPAPACQVFDRAAQFVFSRNTATRASAGWLPIDAKADALATSGELAPLTEATAITRANELGLNLTKDCEPGVRIGISVSGGMLMYGSYEQTHLDIWGLRHGKTSARVIPTVLDAPGAVFVASSQADVVEATREFRQEAGSPVFVFDPQGVVGEIPSWYWSPISWVRGEEPLSLATAELRAAKLAAHFANSVDGRDEAADGSFNAEGEDLLAGLILAAALSDYSIRAVWEWLADSLDDSPVQVFPSMHHGGLPAASGLRAIYNTDVRTRNRIFGAAKRMARCLQLSSIYDWVEVRSDRVALDLDSLIAYNGTLYALSLEGRGSAAPLVSALAEAVVDAALARAAGTNRGRLRVPVIAVFDEAAHVVRWRDLPQVYRRVGLRGVVVITLLDSWEQGKLCWGENGMTALWAAADLRVVGGGLDNVEFLRERLRATTDDSGRDEVPTSNGELGPDLGMRSRFTLADFMGLPRGRVVIFPSGSKPVLVRTVPWWETRHAPIIPERYALQAVRSGTPPLRAADADDADGEE